MLFLSCVVVCLAMAAQSMPPDKGSPHPIQRRSIDSTTAYDAVEGGLVKVVKPTGYHLKLKPYLEDGLYKGHVRINITWLRDSNFIQLHIASQLSFQISLYGVVIDTEKVKLENASRDIETSIATLYLDKHVRAGSKGHVDISFNGSMVNSTSEPFFMTSYKEQEGQKIMVVTHFVRPNSTRRVFPCFDELEYKTPFEISVLRPKHMVALSNMPVARSEDFLPGKVWDHFDRTPPISTISLGLVIAELELLPNSSQYEDDIGNNLDLRVWGRSEFLESHQDLNHNLTRVFHELAHYFNVPLPLRKLDIVLLPNYERMQYYAYAGYDDVVCESPFGLIMISESDLQEYISYLLSYKISYQWLGALTTPARPSDAQLNADLVYYICSERREKISNELGDTEENVWPMELLYSFYYSVASPSTTIYEHLAMKKYQRTLLIRMFVLTMGEKTFKAGLKNFLETHKFKTFTEDDFCEALNDEAKADANIADAEDVNLKKVTQNWLEKDRIPLITVTRNYDNNEAVVTQSVYLRGRPHNVSNANMTWWLPLVIIRQDNLDFQNTRTNIWMKNEKHVILSDMPSNDQFILVNPEEIALYPVNYDRENWRLISRFLQGSNRDVIPPLTRAKLLHDSWNLAYAGELSFAVVFEMAQMLQAERDAIVWKPFLIMLRHLERQITPCVHAKWKAYTQLMLTPIYEELKDVTQEQLESPRGRLRNSAKHSLCSAGYKPCVQEAREKYRKWMTLENPDEGYQSIQPYLCTVFKYGSMEEWDFGVQKVINFSSSHEQPRDCYKLFKTLVGCPTDEVKVTRMLNLILLEGIGNFTEKNISLMFSMITESSEAPIILFKFVKENWDILREKYQNNTKLWDDLIETATSRFTTQDGLDLVAGLYHRHKGEFGSATAAVIENSMKKIKEEAAWSERSLPIIELELDKVLNANNIGDGVYKSRCVNVTATSTISQLLAV